MKGVSPLIAAVLLIAFTMAIAGFIGTWGTVFLQTELHGAAIEGECISALDISSLDYKNGKIFLKLRNTAKINLTGLRATVEYSKTEKNTEYLLENYGVPNSISPASTYFVIINMT